MSLGKVKTAESTGVVVIRTNNLSNTGQHLPYHNVAMEGTHIHPITWPQASGYANNIVTSDLWVMCYITGITSQGTRGQNIYYYQG